MQFEQNTGWRNCVDCGGAFWHQDDNVITCCDRRPTLDDRGRLIFVAK